MVKTKTRSKKSSTEETRTSSITSLNGLAPPPPRIVLSAPASNFRGRMAESLFENENGAQLLRDLSDGDQVNNAFVVRERERRQKRNGEDFLRVVLADKTGTVPAIAWDGVAECFEICA